MGNEARGFGEIATGAPVPGDDLSAARSATAVRTGRRWCVLRTRSRHEQVLVAELTRAGVPAWTPTVERARRYGPHLLTVRQPLFPGYVFVEGDASELDGLRSNARVLAVVPLAPTRAAD